jgi:hypothetical protein
MKQHPYTDRVLIHKKPISGVIIHGTIGLNSV